MTKMICTLGPASSSIDIIERMIQGGMDVARLNFSHGDHESQKQILDNVQAAEKNVAKSLPDGKYIKHIAALLDTKGPEVRTGKTKDGEKVSYKRGTQIKVTADYDVLCDSSVLSLSYDKFTKGVQ